MTLVSLAALARLDRMGVIATAPAEDPDTERARQAAWPRLLELCRR